MFHFKAAGFIYFFILFWVDGVEELRVCICVRVEINLPQTARAPGSTVEMTPPHPSPPPGRGVQEVAAAAESFGSRLPGRVQPSVC